METASSLDNRDLPETPHDALGPPIQERVDFDERSLIIERPSDSYKLLDHPYVHAAFAKDEYMPYWTDIWPAARMLAKFIMRQAWQPDLTALEIGCGLGLPGVAALSKGMEVIFSDYDATALAFAKRNALLNGFSRFRLLQLDWRYPPKDLRVGTIFGSDLIYELRNVEPLAQLLRNIMLPAGICYLVDQDRIPAHALPRALDDARLEFDADTVRAGEPGGRRVKGTLYRIRHRQL